MGARCGTPLSSPLLAVSGLVAFGLVGFGALRHGCPLECAAEQEAAVTAVSAEPAAPNEPCPLGVRARSETPVAAAGSADVCGVAGGPLADRVSVPAESDPCGGAETEAEHAAGGA